MFDSDFAVDVIDTFATGEAYIVTRRKTGTIQNGRNVPGGHSTLEIVASVQPASGRDLLRLPEERRATETRVIFTATQLLVGGQGAAFEADLVTIDGVQWEIQNVENWPGGYTRAMAQVPS